MKKGRLLIVMGAVMVAALCGCQKSQESYIYASKDFDDMTEHADNTEGGVIEVSEVAIKYDTYKTTFTDESLGVTVNADAKVDIPETSQMSVFRVETKAINQDFLDKVRETLSPRVTYYEGKAIRRQTKNAPETVDLEEYQSDNQLHSVNDLYYRNTGDEYYEWQYSINPNGEIFYGVNDAKDGNYISLYAQNNESYGNCLSYRSSKKGYVSHTDIAIGDGYNGRVWQADESDISSHLLIDIDPSKLKETENEPVTISAEQAKQEVEELINSLGLTDFKCYESGLYCEIPSIEGDILYRKVYMLTYLRTIDGVYVNNDRGNKHTENLDGDSHVKKDGGSEKIVILVNDSGIVGFDYSAPIEMLEIVLDKSDLKTFDEIKSIFEEMSVVVHAKEDESVDININRVTLRYTRINEADDFDGGLLVPVWDFIGTITRSYDGSDAETHIQEEVNVLSINAIDGTIIDRDLGY